jgi:tetratricopeptide (TPR) repeat protein
MIPDALYDDMSGQHSSQFDSFTGREDILTEFEQFLNETQQGHFRLFTAKGNSGTGKTFLIEYLSYHFRKTTTWQVGQVSFTSCFLDFRTLLKGLEDALKGCIPPQTLSLYRAERDKYNHSFDNSGASIAIHQNIHAEGFSSIADSNLHTKIDMHLREREHQLRSEWSRALIELAEKSERPLCLFIDNYVPSLFTDQELEKWFWENVLPQLVKATQHPIVTMVCGWEWPHLDAVTSHNVKRVVLKDFSFVQMKSYLEKRRIINSPPNSSDGELTSAFYELTKGHPLVLDLAVTYFNQLSSQERTAQSLQATRPLVNERAQIDFLEERLLKKLTEPHRTLLERGPILRFMNQTILQILLSIQFDNITVHPSKLDDHSYIRFLRYPFITNEHMIENFSPVDQPRFHELVRRVSLETLRHHHPQTKERLDRTMMYYYYNELIRIQKNKNTRHIDIYLRDLQKQGFLTFLKKLFKELQTGKTLPRSNHIEDIFRKQLPIELESGFGLCLEFFYHGLQVKEFQVQMFDVWESLIGQFINIQRKSYAKLILEIIRQLIEEGEAFLQKTSHSHGKYLIWRAKFLGLEWRWQESQMALTEAGQIFEANNDFDNLATCYNNIAYDLVQQGKLELALQYLNKALMLKDVKDRISHEATVLNNIGTIYQIQGNMEQALKYHIQGLDLIKQSGNSYILASFLDNIGTTFLVMGQLDKALSYHKQALNMFIEIKALVPAALSLNSIGEFYRLRGEAKKALAYYKQTLALVEKEGMPDEIANALNNIGLIYDSLGDPNEALKYYKQSLSLVEGQTASGTGIVQILNNIGLVYTYQDDMEQAQVYFERGLQLAENVGQKSGMAASYNHLGLVYCFQGKLERAEKLYTDSLTLREEIGNLADIAQTTHNLADLYINKAGLGLANKLTSKHNNASQLALFPNAIYIDRGMLITSMEYYKKALHLYERSGKGFEPDVADELEVLALCSTFLKKQEEALEYCRRAQKIREETKDIPHQTYTGKGSFPVQISEELIRMLATQVLDNNSLHSSVRKTHRSKKKRRKNR